MDYCQGTFKLTEPFRVYLLMMRKAHSNGYVWSRRLNSQSISQQNSSLSSEPSMQSLMPLQILSLGTHSPLRQLTCFVGQESWMKIRDCFE